MTITSDSPAMFTSKTDEWPTPPDLFNRLDKEFGFTVDVCATPDNAKCDRYFTKDNDGLSQQWTGTCWMNPPYGREIGKWMEKAHAAATDGQADVVVCLVPARTDTAWWHNYAVKGEVRFIRGRLRFGGAKYNAPFPSAIVVFRGKNGGAA